jgi:predicted Zn-dependent protease
MLAANLDPRGMTSMFQKFQAHESSQRAGLEMPQALSSHPTLPKRIARLEGKWKKLRHKGEFLTQTNQIPTIR